MLKYIVLSALTGMLLAVIGCAPVSPYAGGNGSIDASSPMMVNDPGTPTHDIL